MGWYLDEANLAQVSLNLLDYHQASMHTAFEECVKDAKVRISKILFICLYIPVDYRAARVGEKLGMDLFHPD